MQTFDVMFTVYLGEQPIRRWQMVPSTRVYYYEVPSNCSANRISESTYESNCFKR